MYPSVKGDGDGYQYGIVNPVTLSSVGNAYTEDIFIKPSVENGRLETDVTIRNTAPKPRKLTLLSEAVNDRTGEVEKSFPPVTVEAAAGQTLTTRVEGSWKNPKLWWPQPNPQLYRLRTTVSENGRPLDVHEELFGFREVTIRGTGICINGVRRNFWNWVDVHPGTVTTADQWADAWREDKSRFMRFSHGRKITRALPTREERLEYYDRNGIPGRLCTMIDGMFITFNLGRSGPRTIRRKPLLIRQRSRLGEFPPSTWPRWRGPIATIPR